MGRIAKKAKLWVIVAGIVPAMWALGMLSLIAADTVSDDASYAFGFGGIFLFIGGFYLSFVMVPLCTYIGFRLLRTHAVAGTVVLALQVATVLCECWAYFSLG